MMKLETLCNAVINAPNADEALRVFVNSLLADEQARRLRKSERLRRQRQRTITVPDTVAGRTRNLVVDSIQVEGLSSPTFKARIVGRLEDNGKAASIYLLTSGFFGPLNIFK